MLSLSETESSGSTQTSTEANGKVRVGESFTVYALIWNEGADGITTAQLYDGEALIAEKIMAVTGGCWRVVQMDITLDTPGEHMLTLGGTSNTVTVSE